MIWSYLRHAEYQKQLLILQSADANKPARRV